MGNNIAFTTYLASQNQSGSKLPSRNLGNLALATGQQKQGDRKPTKYGKWQYIGLEAFSFTGPKGQKISVPAGQLYCTGLTQDKKTGVWTLGLQDKAGVKSTLLIRQKPGQLLTDQDLKKSIRAGITQGDVSTNLFDPPKTLLENGLNLIMKAPGPFLGQPLTTFLPQKVTPQAIQTTVKKFISSIPTAQHELGAFGNGQDVVDLINKNTAEFLAWGMTYGQFNATLSLAKQALHQYGKNWASDIRAVVDSQLENADITTLRMSQRQIALFNALVKANTSYKTKPDPTTLAELKTAHQKLNESFKRIGAVHAEDGKAIRAALEHAQSSLHSAARADQINTLKALTQNYLKNPSAVNHKVLNDAVARTKADGYKYATDFASAIRQPKEALNLLGQLAALQKLTRQYATSPTPANKNKLQKALDRFQSDKNDFKKADVFKYFALPDDYAIAQQAQATLKNPHSAPTAKAAVQATNTNKKITNAATSTTPKAKPQDIQRVGIQGYKNFDYASPFAQQLPGTALFIVERYAAGPGRYLLSGTDVGNFVGQAFGLPLNRTLTPNAGPQPLYTGDLYKDQIKPAVDKIKQLSGHEVSLRVIPVFMSVGNKVVQTAVFEVQSPGGKNYIVDQAGRAYNSWDHLKGSNQFANADIAIPKDGKFTRDAQGRLELEVFNNRRPDNTLGPVLQGWAAVVGTGLAGVALLGMVVESGGTLSPVAAWAGGALAAYYGVSGAVKLADLSATGTLGANLETLDAALNIVAFGANGAAMGAGMYAVNKAGKAAAIAKILAGAATGTDLSQMALGIVQVADPHNGMNTAERAQMLGQTLFWLAVMRHGHIKSGELSRALAETATPRPSLTPEQVRKAANPQVPKNSGLGNEQVVVPKRAQGKLKPKVPVGNATSTNTNQTPIPNLEGLPPYLDPTGRVHPRQLETSGSTVGAKKVASSTSANAQTAKSTPKVQRNSNKPNYSLYRLTLEQQAQIDQAYQQYVSFTGSGALNHKEWFNKQVARAQHGKGKQPTADALMLSILKPQPQVSPTTTPVAPTVDQRLVDTNPYPLMPDPWRTPEVSVLLQTTPAQTPKPLAVAPEPKLLTGSNNSDIPTDSQTALQNLVDTSRLSSAEPVQVTTPVEIIDSTTFDQPTASKQNSTPSPGRTDFWNMPGYDQYPWRDARWANYINALFPSGAREALSIIDAAFIKYKQSQGLKAKKPAFWFLDEARELNINNQKHTNKQNFTQFLKEKYREKVNSEPTVSEELDGRDQVIRDSVENNPSTNQRREQITNTSSEQQAGIDGNGSGGDTPTTLKSTSNSDDDFRKLLINIAKKWKPKYNLENVSLKQFNDNINAFESSDDNINWMKWSCEQQITAFRQFVLGFREDDLDTLRSEPDIQYFISKLNYNKAGPYILKAYYEKLATIIERNYSKNPKDAKNPGEYIRKLNISTSTKAALLAIYSESESKVQTLNEPASQDGKQSLKLKEIIGERNIGTDGSSADSDVNKSPESPDAKSTEGDDTNSVQTNNPDGAPESSPITPANGDNNLNSQRSLSSNDGTTPIQEIPPIEIEVQEVKRALGNDPNYLYETELPINYLDHIRTLLKDPNLDPTWASANNFGDRLYQLGKSLPPKKQGSRLEDPVSFFADATNLYQAIKKSGDYGTKVKKNLADYHEQGRVKNGNRPTQEDWTAYGQRYDKSQELAVALNLKPHEKILYEGRSIISFDGLVISYDAPRLLIAAEKNEIFKSYLSLIDVYLGATGEFKVISAESEIVPFVRPILNGHVDLSVTKIDGRTIHQNLTERQIDYLSKLGFTTKPEQEKEAALVRNWWILVNHLNRKNHLASGPNTSLDEISRTLAKMGVSTPEATFTTSRPDSIQSPTVLTPYQLEPGKRPFYFGMHVPDLYNWGVEQYGLNRKQAIQNMMDINPSMTREQASYQVPPKEVDFTEPYVTPAYARADYKEGVQAQVRAGFLANNEQRQVNAESRQRDLLEMQKQDLRLKQWTIPGVGTYSVQKTQTILAVIAGGTGFVVAMNGLRSIKLQIKTLNLQTKLQTKSINLQTEALQHTAAKDDVTANGLYDLLNGITPHEYNEKLLLDMLTPPPQEYYGSDAVLQSNYKVQLAAWKTIRSIEKLDFKDASFPNYMKRLNSFVTACGISNVRDKLDAYFSAQEDNFNRKSAKVKVDVASPDPVTRKAAEAMVKELLIEWEILNYKKQLARNFLNTKSTELKKLKVKTKAGVMVTQDAANKNADRLAASANTIDSYFKGSELTKALDIIANKKVVDNNTTRSINVADKNTGLMINEQKISQGLARGAIKEQQNSQALTKIQIGKTETANRTAISNQETGASGQYTSRLVQLNQLTIRGYGVGITPITGPNGVVIPVSLSDGVGGNRRYLTIEERIQVLWDPEKTGFNPFQPPQEALSKQPQLRSFKTVREVVDAIYKAYPPSDIRNRPLYAPQELPGQTQQSEDAVQQGLPADQSSSRPTPSAQPESDENNTR